MLPPSTMAMPASNASQRSMLKEEMDPSANPTTKKPKATSATNESKPKRMRKRSMQFPPFTSCLSHWRGYQDRLVARRAATARARKGLSQLLPLMTRPIRVLREWPEYQKKIDAGALDPP